jgi:S-adenosylmethionine decarboxylase
MTWGYALSLDVARCCKKAINDPVIIKAFTQQLVRDINMIAYGPTHVIRFGSGNKEGYSMFQLIETSNISAHFCNETGDAYFDIFSCKPYNKDIVRHLVVKYFKGDHMKEHYVERQAPELK